jgi:hypothetical protein
MWLSGQKATVIHPDEKWRHESCRIHNDVGAYLRRSATTNDGSGKTKDKMIFWTTNNNNREHQNRLAIFRRSLNVVPTVCRL